MKVRILHTEYPRFPLQDSFTVGQSVPKARPFGVVDGRAVNILLFILSRYQLGNDEVGSF